MDAPLIDAHGRAVSYLRLSVTDRCNLRCRYCMPAEGLPTRPKDEVLTFEDIVFLVQQACALGVRHVRITGGEPLLRRELPALVRALREETPVEELAMTTNALLLHKHVDALVDAGLSRINVSLDSLRPDRFERITRVQLLEETWRGLRAAEAAGLSPIKINTVLLRGFNDDEVEDWLELTRGHAYIVRFLELMPMGEGSELRRLGAFEDVSAVRRALVERHGLEPCDAHVGNGPARYWAAPGAKGALGFITPMSAPYCDTCTRFRVTATGELRPCLAEDVHVHLREAVRARDARAVREGFLEAARRKPAGHRWRAGHETATGMSALGG